VSPIPTAGVWTSNRAVAGAATGLGLLALAILLALPPAQDDRAPLVALRALLVYPGWLMMPGLPWLGWLLARRDDATCPLLAVLGAAALSIVIQAGNLALFKALGVMPTPLPYLALAVVEGLPAAALLLLGRPLLLERPPLKEWIATGIAMAMLLTLGAAFAPEGTRPMEAYWYDARADSGDWEQSSVRLWPEGDWGDPLRSGNAGEDARQHDPSGADLAMVADSAGDVTAVLLLRAEVGASLALVRDGEVLQRKTIETHPQEREDEGPVLRYVDAGIVTVVEDLTVLEGDRLEVVVDADPGFVLYDLTSSDPEAVWMLEELGLHEIHYYQLLNIAENVEWARELWTTRHVTLNQPPMWSYYHAGAALLNGPDLPAVYFVFLLVLAAISAVGVRLVAALVPGAPMAALLLPAAGALHHGYHVLMHAEASFPDNLFTLSITAACYALVRSDAAAFGGVGMASTILRYPGSVVVSWAALLWGLFGGRWQVAIRPLVAMWLPIGLFCGAMLAAGAVTGQLGDWFFVLYFETFPEHWHGEYEGSALLSRIPLFYAELVEYGGYLPLFVIPLLGRGARWLTAVALSYSLLLCTIDHFTIHYHLPLMALFAAAAGCNTAAVGQRWGGVAGGIAAALALAVALVTLPVWW
jgi:hypothetical protein